MSKNDEVSERKITVTLDAETALALDELLRNGLVASGALDPKDNLSVRPTVSLSIDEATAAKFSELLRNGLLASSSAHNSNNANIARAMKKIIENE